MYCIESANRSRWLLVQIYHWLIRHCLVQELRHLQSCRYSVISFGTLFQTVNLADFSAFSPRHINSHRCCPLGSASYHPHPQLSSSYHYSDHPPLQGTHCDAEYFAAYWQQLRLVWIVGWQQPCLTACLCCRLFSQLQTVPGKWSKTMGLMVISSLLQNAPQTLLLDQVCQCHCVHILLNFIFGQLFICCVFSNVFQCCIFHILKSYKFAAVHL